MVSSTTVNQTGAIYVSLETTRHDKARALVCFTAKGDGAKFKLFIGFAGVKRESKNLHEKI